MKRMTRLPLPQRKPYCWPSREWDKTLTELGLDENREQTIDMILSAYAFIRRHHWATYRDMITRMRRIVELKPYKRFRKS